MSGISTSSAPSDILDRFFEGETSAADGFFSEAARSAAHRVCHDGGVRVVTANLGVDFAGIFGTVQVSDRGPRSEVSVVLHRSNGEFAVDGSASGERERNGPQVLALLLQARGNDIEVISPDSWYGEMVPVGDRPESDGSPGVEDGEDGEECIDWFEFECGFEIDGRRINLLPAIVDYLQSQPDAFCPDRLAELPPGSRVPLTVGEGSGTVAIPAERLYHILSALVELHDPGALTGRGTLTLHAARAVQLTSSPESRRQFISASPHQLMARIRAVSEVEFPGADDGEAPPSTFQGTLRPYQVVGFRWLQFLRGQKMGGVLADDMGLGKTVQTLCHLLCEKNSGRGGLPALIVAPKSVLHNWAAEAEKFAPSLRVLVLSGPQRRRYFSVMAYADVVITSYPLLVRDVEVLRAQPFHCVILDEAQLIKNPRSAMFRAACTLDARHRLCLSGTPIENHLGELWSLFQFLMPGFLGSQEAFQRLYRVPIEKQRDDRRRTQLAERVRPFLLRRTKERVASDLPPKSEFIQEIELNAAQSELYEAVRASLDARVREEIAARGLKASKIFVLEALLKLRQICCHPRLLKLDSVKKTRGDRSAKLDRLGGMIGELVEEGRRVLIFSQFTEMLSILSEEFSGAGIPFVSLTGRTRDRRGVCESFQAGKVPVFLISLRAGGTGLNLTAADTVIHYDPWWNPALESQATDRAHRIGQQNPVFVYKLISRGTIEQKILLLQRKKRALYEGILSGAPQALDFSEADLDLLMAPIRQND